SAVATGCTPSGTTRCSATSYPSAVSRSTSATPLRSSRVPWTTPSDTVSTFAVKPAPGAASLAGPNPPKASLALGAAALSPAVAPRACLSRLLTSRRRLRDMNGGGAVCAGDVVLGLTGLIRLVRLIGLTRLTRLTWLIGLIGLIRLTRLIGLIRLIGLT